MRTRARTHYATTHTDTHTLAESRSNLSPYVAGVHKSDVLVILATKAVLTRPWCLMEMWEAAVNAIPIVLFPVSGGGWTKDDARTLLSDLIGQVKALNPTCMAEVMAHVGTQGVIDVREVEDVLLAHIGLVSHLERPGRPASADFDRRLCDHLKMDVADLSEWLLAHNEAVEQRLSAVSWQSWGSDNQIIASVQSLIGECVLARGRAQPEWKDTWVSVDERSIGKPPSKGLLRRLCWQRQAPGDAGGRLLIVCARNECGGPARLLQRQLGKNMQCEVVIGSNHVDIWRGEVESATRGVVLLQTQTVLRDPVRLLQLFEAVQLRQPLVCVNVVSGGYDFAKVKPLLLSLSSELPPGEMATLRSELMANGNDVGQLESGISDAVTNAISVFFNPAAGDAMMEAAIGDVMDKLERDPTKRSSPKMIMSSPRTSPSKVCSPNVSLPSRRQPVLDVGPAAPHLSPVPGIIRPLPLPSHTRARQPVLPSLPPMRRDAVRQIIIELKKRGESGGMRVNGE